MKKFSRTTLIPAFFLVGLSLILLGCGDDDDGGPSGPSGPQGTSTTATIGITGGNVTHESCTVVIPPGALADDADIEIGIPQTQPAYQTPADVDQIGYTYEAGPSPLSFALPVSVVLTYHDNDLGGYEESTLMLWTFDNEGDIPAELDAIYVDEVNNTVTGLTDHFSFFILTVSTEGMPQDPPATPMLALPANGAVDQPLTVAFSWTSSFGADTYTFELATDPGFSLPIIQDTNILSNTYTVSDLSTTTTYYWRVMAHNEAGDSDWSAIWHFTTGSGGGGGNIVGVWAYDQTDYDFIGLPPGTDVIMEGWGDIISSLNTNGTFATQGNQWIHLTMSFSGFPVMDTTYVMPVYIEGTYFTTEDSLTTTVTHDEYNPENVGSTVTQYYQVNGDNLMLVYAAEEMGYATLATSYYTRQ
jgi:hypothetical protein